MTSPGALLHVLSRALSQARFARAGRAWILWWEPAQSATPRAELARLGAGTLRNLELVAGESGAGALAEALRRELLPLDLAQALGQGKAALAREELKRAASELVPDARIVDLSNASPSLASMRARELALVRRVIVAAAREQHSQSRSAAWQVAVYAPSGEVELVFVWPRGAAQGGSLARLARLASWRDSVI
jgi:hypothetical protein